MLTHVYIDTRKDTGQAFYIGMGLTHRLHYLKRNKFHSAVVAQAGGFVRTIIESFEQRQDACAFERYLINSYGLDNLTNIKAGGGSGVCKHLTTAERDAANKAAMVIAKANFEAKTDMKAYKAAAQRRWTARQKEKLNA